MIIVTKRCNLGDTMDTVPSGAPAHTPVGRGGDISGNLPKNKQKKNKIKLAAIAAAVLLLLFVGWVVFSLYRSSTAANINGGKYQALFLTNGQVYFGKLSYLNGSYMKLTDIFYLQAKTPTTDGDSQNPQETDTGSDVQLVKLGNEVHGPSDEMIINKDQILFFENLKEDGTVSKTIQQYKPN